MTNTKEQRLELIRFTGFKKSGKKFYKTALFQCKCGNEKEAYLHNVLANRTTSCGCAFLEHAAQLNYHRKCYGRYKAS